MELPCEVLDILTTEMMCQVPKKKIVTCLRPSLTPQTSSASLSLKSSATRKMKFLSWIQILVAISQTCVGRSAARSFVLSTNATVIFAVPVRTAAVNESTVAGEADVSESKTGREQDTNSAEHRHSKLLEDMNSVVMIRADTTTNVSVFIGAKVVSELPSAAIEYMNAAASKADTATETSTSNTKFTSTSRLVARASESAKPELPEVTSAPDVRRGGSKSIRGRKHVQFAIRDGSVKSRGVNLGGWLVAEHWMTKNSEIWWGLSSNDADRGEFTAMNLTHSELAAQRAKVHRDTFITEHDIEAIARAGINMVRVPVGYWIVGFDHHDVSNKQEWRVYAPGGLDYLDRLIRDWATKHNVAVLISMHAAKGSQNGADHSSPTVQGSSFWSRYPENIASTLDAVRFLARRYKADDAFLGIGLLNEPSGSTTTAELYQYYEDAYKRIREDDANDCVLTISPLLAEQSPKYMTEVLPHATNVWVEWHRYFIWGYEDTSESNLLLEALPAFRTDVEQWKSASDKKLFIGEFSFASARGQFSSSLAKLQEFAKEQMKVLESVVDGGWAFWTWRVDGDDDSSNPLARWSLRKMLANQVMPPLSSLP